MSFNAVGLQYPYTGNKKLKPVPERQCPCAQNKLHEDSQLPWFLGLIMSFSYSRFPPGISDLLSPPKKHWCTG